MISGSDNRNSLLFPVVTVVTIMFPGVSTAKAQQGNTEVNKDRDVNISILKEVPFTLSNFTINGNVQFNVNYSSS